MIETSSDESFHKMEGKDKGFIYVRYNEMFSCYGKNVCKVWENPRLNNENQTV